MSPTFTREEIVYWLTVAKCSAACEQTWDHAQGAIDSIVMQEHSREIQWRAERCLGLVRWCLDDTQPHRRERPTNNQDARELLTIRALLRAELARRMGR